MQFNFLFCIPHTKNNNQHNNYLQNQIKALLPIQVLISIDEDRCYAVRSVTTTSAVRGAYNRVAFTTKTSNREHQDLKVMKLSAGLAVLAMLFGLSCGEHFITSNNEILSALTWASLDSKLLTGRSFKTSPDGYNLTQFSYNNNTSALSSPVKKRTLQIRVTDPAFMNLEIKFIIPLLEIYEGTFIKFEMPLSYNLLFPTLGKRGGREWDTSLVPIITHLEDLVSMLGVDGGVCIRRAICELAEAPTLQVHGFVGEVVHILMRHIIEDSMVENENSINTNEGSDPDNLSMSKGDYIKAGQHGRQKGECWKAYSECPVSLFNLLASS